MAPVDQSSTRRLPRLSARVAWGSASFSGPPLPSVWPRPTRRILVATADQPGCPSGLGRHKLAAQVTALWG